MQKIRFSFLLVLLSSMGTALEAQDARLGQVDRIVAIVGRTVITYARVEEELNIRRQQGDVVPSDSAGRMEFRRDILKRLVDDELLLQAALRDTMVQVNEQDLQAEIEPIIRQVRGQFASEEEYGRNLRAAGFSSPDDYRQWITEQKRRDMLRDTYMQLLSAMGEMTPLPPTETELREFYDKSKDQQPPRPPTVSFRQVVIRPEADSAELRRAFVLADSLAKAIRDGADFNLVARRFSDDSASSVQGGEMGWVRRGQGLVREFEAAAFRLRPGAISNPVRTPFGFHIIEVLRSQPAEVQLRHILIAPNVTDADRAAARTLADEVAAALRNGAPFDSLARLYHDENEQRVADDAAQEDLPPVYAQLFAGATPGSILGPVELDRRGRVRYAVVEFGSARAGGEFTYEDLRDQMRRALSQQNALERFLKKLRDKTYIEIRM